MNLSFEGERVELAERYVVKLICRRFLYFVRTRLTPRYICFLPRYTNMTKILFLTLWYCSVYPVAWFLCSITLFVNYFTDRYSLMRTWKRPPQLGTTVSKVSRRYFFNLAIIAMATMSSFFWSGFPFDNLCVDYDATGDPSSGSNYVGDFFIKFRGFDAAADKTEQELHSANITSLEGTSYKYCNQNLIKPGRGNTFPFIAAQQPEGEEWMTEDQEFVTTIYGTSSVGVIIIIVAMFLWGWVEACKSLFSGSYSVSEIDQDGPHGSVVLYVSSSTRLSFFCIFFVSAR